MIATCSKCGIDFGWEEKDALVKFAYGEKFLVSCPNCKHLMKAFLSE